MIGQRFGRWSVVAGPVRLGTHPAYFCRCECGSEQIIREWSLHKGITQSCGCLKNEITRKRSTTHGDSPRGILVSEYRIWHSMIARCHRPNAQAYERYGGRGITVCERWRESYPAFLADMGRRPSKRHGLERKDNDGPYAPGNVVWATAAEQARNRRNTPLYEMNGERLCIKDWAERYGLMGRQVSPRLARGWGLRRALTTPLGPSRR